MKEISFPALVLLLILFFTWGYVTSEVVDQQLAKSKNKKLLGFYMENANTTQRDEYKQNAPLGDWVCVNVEELDYSGAFDVCVHECSHQAYSEIFAEECEKDISKCREVIYNETE